jgi:hypothetical protein
MTDTIIVTPSPAVEVTVTPTTTSNSTPSTIVVSATTSSNTQVTSPITNTGTNTAPIIGINQTLLSLTKSQVGLGNVDNTSDINKPISTATQTALDGKQATGSYLTSVPVASTSVSGTVIVDGTTITINGSGVISGANIYSLPTASGSVLGGVKVGTNLSIDGSGVLSATVPAASTTTPSMDGTAAVGTATTYARADHVHATDTSLASLAGNNSFTGANTFAPSTTNAVALTLTPNGTGNQITGSNFSVSSGGTITQGTSTATFKVDASYGQVSIRNSGANIGSLTVGSGNVTTLGVVVKGVGSQTADLIQLQSSASVILGGANAAGQIYAGAVPATTGNGYTYTLTSVTANSATSATFTYAATTQYAAAGQTVTITGMTGFNGTWQIASVATVSAGVTYSFTVTGTGFTGSLTAAGKFGLSSAGSFTATTAYSPAIIAKGAASQSSALQEWQDSTGAVKASISSSGALYTDTINGQTSLSATISIGSSRNLALVTASPSYGSGAGVIMIGNAATPPSTSPTNGGVLYSDSGALRWVAPTSSASFVPASSLVGATAMKTGYYYTTPGSFVTTSGLMTPTINTVYAVPIVVTTSATAVKLGIFISTLGGATNSTELGIYYNAAGDVPGARLLDAGAIDTSINGSATTFASVTISQALTPGLYWLALLSTSTTSASISQAQMVQNFSQPVTSTASPTNITNNGGWRMTGQTTLPATFTATWGSTSNPAIWIGF